MIIGNNNNFTNNNFAKKFKEYNQNKPNNSNSNIFVKDISQQKYSNVNSKEDMYNKSLAMLNERLNKGLISMEEFNKQCKKLGNLRQK